MNFTSNATDDGTHPQRTPPREVSEDLARPSDGQNQFDVIRVEVGSGSLSICTRRFSIPTCGMMAA
jgi:hypothetical protein